MNNIVEGEKCYSKDGKKLPKLRWVEEVKNYEGVVPKKVRPVPGPFVSDLFRSSKK